MTAFVERCLVDPAYAADLGGTCARARGPAIGPTSRTLVAIDVLIERSAQVNADTVGGVRTVSALQSHTSSALGRTIRYNGAFVGFPPYFFCGTSMLLFRRFRG